MNLKSLRSIIAILVALFAFSGCKMFIQDMTARQLEQNPSSIYTFDFKVNTGQTNIVEGSMKADIVIEGETHRMVEESPGYFKYEYRVNPEQTMVRYYYVLEYDYVSGGATKHAVKYSTDYTPKNLPFEAQIVNRYVIKLVSNRGPVGASIDVVGRGFSEFDKILIGGQEAQTNFRSPTSMSFVVPNLLAGRSYPVFLRTADGDINGGLFRIDAAVLSVMPAQITVGTGEQELVNFTLPFAAPAGGMTLDVSTDISQSVIMPEVVVPAGETSVTVFVEGSQPGSGYLIVEGQGFQGVSVPITVTGESEAFSGESDSAPPPAGSTANAGGNLFE